MRTMVLFLSLVMVYNVHGENKTHYYISRYSTVAGVGAYRTGCIFAAEIQLRTLLQDALEQGQNIPIGPYWAKAIVHVHKELSKGTDVVLLYDRLVGMGRRNMHRHVISNCDQLSIVARLHRRDTIDAIDQMQEIADTGNMTWSESLYLLSLVLRMNIYGILHRKCILHGRFSCI